MILEPEYELSLPDLGELRLKRMEELWGNQKDKTAIFGIRIIVDPELKGRDVLVVNHEGTMVGHFLV
jgi:hypothetical protein